MTREECQELKRRLTEATDFHQFQDYFFSNFVERGSFMSLGRKLSRPRSQFLVEAATSAYRQFNPSSAPLDAKPMFIEIPEFGLIHGQLRINGTLASILYFEETGQGLLAVVADPAAGRMHYVRITAKRVRGDASAN